jgi:hypothetical protein
MGDFPDIPAGYGIPLVDLATDLLPAETMAALDDRYEGGGAVDSVNGQTGVVVIDAATPASVADGDAATLAAALDYTDYTINLTGSGLTGEFFKARKFADGRVSLTGRITDVHPTDSITGVFANMPSAVRPAYAMRQTAANQATNGQVALAIEPDGDVVALGLVSPGESFAMDGINYLAADSI